MKLNLRECSALKYAVLFGVISLLFTGCIIWPGRGRDRDNHHGHDNFDHHDRDHGRYDHN